jgi:hypothetical protein
LIAKGESNQPISFTVSLHAIASTDHGGVPGQRHGITDIAIVQACCVNTVNVSVDILLDSVALLLCMADFRDSSKRISKFSGSQEEIIETKAWTLG